MFTGTKEAVIILSLIAIFAGYFSFLPIQTQLNQYLEWKNKYKPTFKSQIEDKYRQTIFNQNVKAIQIHNSDTSKSFTMGINQFTALTQQQFVYQYLGTFPINSNVKLVSESNQQDQFIFTMDIDWVSNGAVTQVKNQGQCQSCWAFSATGSLQGLNKILSGQLKGFSEQQLIDCSGGRFGNQGCNGGTQVNAFNYVKEKGIYCDKTYPYRGMKGQCKSFPADVLRISGHTIISPSCNEVINALSIRPLSAIADATSWANYNYGIYNKCGSNPSLNHGVVIVGIYAGSWRLKNSWGTAWGEHGYIRLAGGNMCGICNMASYPNK